MSTWRSDVIDGHYLDGRTAASQTATLEFGGDGTLRILGLGEPISMPLADVKISERIANVTRRFLLPGGAVFETDENDAVDQACASAGVKLRSGVVYWLESRWPVAMASLVAVALLVFGFMRWGVPVVADWAAEAVPVEVDRAIGNGYLEYLEGRYLYASSISPERQAQLQQKFSEMTADLKDGHHYELLIRDGDIGPNAFALPSGIVVMTDQLVQLAESDDELVAVLAHEIGHVRGRHQLRQLFRAAGVSAMAMAVLGDVSQISGLLTFMPSLLKAKHSREFEIEADQYAKQWLRAHDIDERHFDRILCRMTSMQGGSLTLDFISTHPPTDERARCEEK